MRYFFLSALIVTLATLLFGITVDVNAATIVRAPNNLNLVGYWSFDEGSGTVAGDLSGNGNDGVIVNATWTDGRRGKALDFDGSGDYVQIDSNSTLQIDEADGITITAWIKLRHPGNFSAVLTKTDVFNENSAEYAFYLSGSTRVLAYTSGVDGLNKSTDGTVPLDEWVFVAVSKESGSTKLWLNETLNDKGAVSIGDNSGSAPVKIGSWTTSSGGLDGLIDDVRIYSRALSAGEITDLYNSGRVILGSGSGSLTAHAAGREFLTSGLVGYWDFDGPNVTGSTVTDISGNGNDATINGDAEPALGKIGQGFKFDGSGDDLILSHDSTLDPGTGDITVAVWLKVEPGNQYAFSKRHIFDGYQLNIDSFGTLDMFWGDGSVYVFNLAGVSNIVDGQWHHVALTFDHGGTAIGYVDGVQDATKDISSVTGTVGSGQSGYIGQYVNNYYVNGLLDDLRIYSRVLTADEITQLYQTGR